MSRRLFQIVAGIVLILAALTPLMECFDHWDKSPGPANDTEIHLTAWFVAVGIALTLAKLLRYVPAFIYSRRSDQAFCTWPGLRKEADDRPEPTVSPPMFSLRI